jgi:hypothetical protein
LISKLTPFKQIPFNKTTSVKYSHVYQAVSNLQEDRLTVTFFESKISNIYCNTVYRYCTTENSEQIEGEGPEGDSK